MLLSTRIIYEEEEGVEVEEDKENEEEKEEEEEDHPIEHESSYRLYWY